MAPADTSCATPSRFQSDFVPRFELFKETLMMEKPQRLAAFCVLAAWAAWAPAQAQDAATLNLRSLAATCASCHGTNGRAVAGSVVVPLAGLSKDYISTQLRDFKSGARPATVMNQIAKGYTDAQIESLAGYFATIKP
jgi:cytochrome subunit of sulfide dehydrogenase